MKCIICSGRMEFYFSKDFDAFGLGKVDYWRCRDCGFSMSRTHAEMTRAEWESLNRQYHSTYQAKDSNADDPRWTERLQSQATVLADAVQVGLLNGDGRWLDYACGDGKLSELLRSDGITLEKYDRYMSRQEGYLRDDEITARGFDFVITTSVFEHFTKREEFDSVESLVSANGVLGLHTLVREDIPCDSSWFYLLPVHCAFHTNRSMALLLEQWGYASSVYNVDSRLWLLFKKPASDMRHRVDAANRRVRKPTYILKDGFVDYWK